MLIEVMKYGELLLGEFSYPVSSWYKTSDVIGAPAAIFAWYLANVFRTSARSSSEN